MGVKRRRHPRFLLANTWEGELRTCEDITLEECRGDQIWISSALGAREGESLTLAVLGAPGLVTVPVRAVASAPVAHGGFVTQRVALVAQESNEQLLDRIPRKSAPAVLWRATSVTVLELSRSGCLVESRTAVAGGAIAVLRVEAPSARVSVDGVRVVWCRLREGSATYRIGTELLPTMREAAASGEDSLREIVTGLELPYQ
jgi:hypothetical protein